MERALRALFGVMFSASEPDAKKEEFLEVAVDAPRAGAGGRSPEDTSARSLAASFLIMRKRPSMAS